ncbi:telomere-associated protein Tap [Streptomyces sp. NPDC001633]|uniref:telomere-associated protein Tap n=1 Tax=Streptomyces sp. NPDC001633 TaxID=3364595 RepID=UPI0036748F35
MSEQNEQFSAVDALLAQVREGDLPTRAERRRLREAAGLSHAEVGTACGVRRETAAAWDAPKGKTEPRPPHRAAYARLLRGLAEMFPAPSGESVVPAWAARQAPEAARGPEGPASMRADGGAALSAMPTAPAPAAPAPAAAVVSVPERKSTSRRPGARKAARPSAEYVNGPLAVVDVDDAGQASAYCVGGVVLDVPAASLPDLVHWAVFDAQLGAPRLNDWGRDADPLVVLTAAAAARFGLPAALTAEERRAGRLSADHDAHRELAAADWKTTQRGLGPWARIYRAAEGSRRLCVQLACLGWDALEPRTWGRAAELHPAALAGLLGDYTRRVMTPCGAAATTGLELMTALRPPTRPGPPDETGKRTSAHNPGSLGKVPMDPALPEAPDGHPLLADLPRWHQRGPEERVNELAFDWARQMTDEEALMGYLVGIDTNAAYCAASNALTVGLSKPPVHFNNPEFDPKRPGCWLVDLSHVDMSRVMIGGQWRTLRGDLLPSPFTAYGEAPTGPAWYTTQTVAYAVELGYTVQPLEAWLRPEAGRYLDHWHKRLRAAFVDTMAALGVTTDMTPEQYLAAMDRHKEGDPAQVILLNAIKATVKGGIGKLRQKPRGGGWRPGQPWPALERPTWRPDIQAAVVAKARINMHRKVIHHAAATGHYPVAILADNAVYAATGPSALDVVPYDADGKPVPGGWRLGVSPGLMKHEGTQTNLWAEAAYEEFGPKINLARYIKTGQIKDAPGDDQ